MRFEWDHAKEEINIRKHGVDFDEAADTFYDPSGLERPDEGHSGYEERFIRLGASRRGRILVTAFTERGESIRIISSRRATRREVKSYEEGI
ncbi:MAG: BrnT family toxin [Candidatus Rokubacteria bacterium]|nr:BrnT family toxin [Candidatus Rokubacteria bacterium]